MAPRSDDSTERDMLQAVDRHQHVPYCAVGFLRSARPRQDAGRGRGAVEAEEIHNTLKSPLNLLSRNALSAMARRQEIG
jgi:hypothetical protein